VCAGFYLFVISPGYAFAIWDRTRGGGNKEWPAIYHGSRVGGVLNCRCVNAGGSAGITKQKKIWEKTAQDEVPLYAFAHLIFKRTTTRKKRQRNNEKKKWKKEEEGIKLD
jgi:hypothetical protein